MRKHFVLTHPEVLGAVVEERHGKENCLVDSEEAFCGIGIVYKLNSIL